MPARRGSSRKTVYVPTKPYRRQAADMRHSLEGAVYEYISEMENQFPFRETDIKRYASDVGVSQSDVKDAISSLISRGFVRKSRRLTPDRMGRASS